MDQARYKELVADNDLMLSDQEIAEGWHFCADWDFLLIHKDWPESESCNCYGPRKRK